MSISFKDYYETLGVSREAPPEDIKRAFRNLARTYHPDKAEAAGRESSEAKFKEINEAYEVLKDPEKRKKYDALGENWDQYGDMPEGSWNRAASRNARRGQRSRDPGYEYHFGGTGFSDFFEQFFGGQSFGDMSGFSGARRRAESFSVRGGDLESEIMVTFEEVARGSTRRISFSLVNPSTGQEGRREFDLRIPVGVQEGQRLRVAGRGETGLGAGPSGDLYLTVKYEQHPDFEAKGKDLYCELELAPWEAALGTKVSAPTLEGPVRVTVPAGTSSGRQLRLRGKGLPSGDGQRGDLYATVSIAMPPSPTEKEKKLWEELARTSPFKPKRS